jgi:hypothetical protein
MYALPWGTARRSLRRDLGLAISLLYLLLRSGSAAATSNGPARAFPGASVGARALAVGRKAPAVTQAPIRTYFYQAANVLVHFPPQVALCQVLPVHQLSNTVYLGLIEFVHSRSKQRINVGLDQYLRS